MDAKAIIFHFFIFLLFPIEVVKADIHSYKLKVSKNSIIAIEGKSNLVDFNCIQKDIEGFGSIDSSYLKDLEVFILVENMDCGHNRINRDMKKTLQNEKFPLIVYKILAPSKMNVDLTAVDQWKANTIGQLEIAGECREIAIEFVLKKEADGSYRVEGEKELDLTNFGISPPRALMGLIRVKKKLKLFFNLEIRSGVK